MVDLNPFNIKKIMEKAKDMQKQMQYAQQQLKGITVIGTAGGGLVKAHVNGLHHALRVEISPTILEDKDMLEDLTVAAFNDAASKIEEIIKQKMGELAQEMDLPEGAGELE
jgi:DNA-binding YbaB/EbfC family protein